MPGFAGGYVGIDIFFVISGYLIINQIIEDIEAKRFSFFGFATRRTFRILPAFLLVMVCTLVLATTVFVQPEHKEFAESLFLSGIMLANHHFLAHRAISTWRRSPGRCCTCGRWRSKSSFICWRR